MLNGGEQRPSCAKIVDPKNQDKTKRRKAGCDANQVGQHLDKMGVGIRDGGKAQEIGKVSRKLLVIYAEER